MTAKIKIKKSTTKKIKTNKKTQKFVIPENAAKTRLDATLTELSHVSRSQIQKLIDQRLVLINGKPATKHGQPLRAGDAIVIAKTTDSSSVVARSKATKQSQGFHKKTPPTNDGIASASGLAMTKLAPEIIFKNSEFVVINKPAGLLVHPTQAHEKNTLTAWLVKKFPKIKTVGDDPAIRPGIVHRLDKEASGLMVVALTQKSFLNLKNQFKNREITKEYLALVHGKIERNWEHLYFPIARGENNDRMAALPVTPYIPQGAKEAHTEYITEKVFANCTLVRVFLHTGRMHQIRVHFLAYNHPLVGDPLYFQKKRKKNLDAKAGRLFLHSTKLGFIDLTGQPQTFESTLPINLANLLKNLS